MYEMTNVIPFVDAGADGKLKLHNAVAMMMNCCQFQEYQEEKFCAYLRQNHLAVFLFSIQLDILRMPEFREKVKTAVKIYGCRSIYGLRQITMHDEKNDLCLIADATGAFFDIEARKAVKLEPAALGVVYDEPLPMECLGRKIPIPATDPETAPALTVTRSLLDPNGHLTSHGYFALAGDVLPPDFSFDRVRMEFKQQASPDEKVTPFLYRDGEKRIVVDMRGESHLSCAVAEFTTRPR